MFALRRLPASLFVCLGLVALVHLVAIFAQPQPTLSGDEHLYVKLAVFDARDGTKSLLPGTLRFEDRPQLASRVFALVLPRPFAPAGEPRREGEPAPERREPNEEDARRELAFRRAVSTLNLVCLLGLICTTFATGRLLGLSDRAAVTAAGLLGAFPWLGFYVHVFWPEILHAFLLGLGCLLIVSHLTRRSPPRLGLAGIILGYALLTKGAVNGLLPFVLVFLGAHGWRGAQGPWLARMRAALIPPAICLAGCCLVVVPQGIANSRAGHGLRLAANRWWNLELGLTAPVTKEPGQRRPEYYIRHAYLDAAESGEEREALSRQRTLAYIEETGPLVVAGAQLRKLGRTLFSERSFMEQSLRGRARWGRAPPWWTGPLVIVGRVLWFTILGLGLIGLGLIRPRTGIRGSAGLIFVLVVTAYFLVALLAIPIKTRFAMPLVPFLVLLAGYAVDTLRLRRAAAAQLLSSSPR